MIIIVNIININVNIINMIKIFIISWTATIATTAWILTTAFTEALEPTFT